MNTALAFPCTRCGKDRIVSKTWKEVTISSFGGMETVTIHTETICPDPDCQKFVDEKLAVDREKYLLHQQKKNTSPQNRKKAEEAAAQHAAK